METSIVSWSIYWGNIRIMEKKMETTILGLGYYIGGYMGDGEEASDARIWQSGFRMVWGF